ncbi:HEPN domain protein [Ferroglobus placidus DSM 10642]|uniref:HEPN domain protein n=1 Tax=Ferroglobus placidus (strain DSM 10642 / AEDII12DO) TaxID=589924 RepID=D3RXK7_FERPA|nr:HEPN domain-containing protein [Ferroglobus placidus]ADC65220.1 HEPN domain protein [Ferroglobus placidus DSM 10642]
MKKEEVEKFIEKAKGFEEMAKFNFEKGRYDLAMFCVEQAAQLYIKAKFLELIGEFPRTHDLIKLLGNLSEEYNKSGTARL